MWPFLSLCGTLTKSILEDSKNRVKPMQANLERVKKSRLSQTGEDILLCLWKQGTACGSEIMKDLNGEKRRWKRLTNQGIYYSLTKLEESEMIRLVEKKSSWNQPDRKYYGLTQKGKEEVLSIKEYRTAIGG